LSLTRRKSKRREIAVAAEKNVKQFAQLDDEGCSDLAKRLLAEFKETTAGETVVATGD
jgi:hypothetical protein